MKKNDKGYYLVSIPIVFERTLQNIDYGSYMKRGERVAIRELERSTVRRRRLAVGSKEIG